MTRRWATRALLATAVLAALWAGSGVLAARALTTRRGAITAEPPPPGFTSLRLRTSDGLAIGAWLRRAAAPRAAVVMVHGNGSSRSALAGEARALAERGVTAMPITVRAHGDSEGDRNDLGWSARRDVIAAVARLRELEPGVPVIVHGTSLGAAAAIFAAGELGDRADGYLLIAPYADLELAVERRTDRYLPPGLSVLAYGALWLGGRLVVPELDRIEPAAAARAIPRSARVVVVCGGADDRAPESDARAIASAVPGARVVVLPGLDHGAVARAVATERLDLVLELVGALD